ncbi:MAG: OmpH family outer membrane protein [Planctomycetes bacterium]|nr:OmpH family outer membrane protein [Planctomycetota bacterium]
MNRMTQLVSVPTVTIAIGLGAVLGQRALAPAAPVLAVVKINELFDELQQRADARIDLRRLELEIQDEKTLRESAIAEIEGDLEQAVAAARRDELADDFALKKLQMQFWFREAMTELEVEKALLLQNLYRSMIEAIEALAATEGYDMVIIDDASAELTFDRDSRVPPQVQVQQQIIGRKILYRNPALDITMDLATRMNNLYRAP